MLPRDHGCARDRRANELAGNAFRYTGYTGRLHALKGLLTPKEQALNSPAGRVPLPQRRRLSRRLIAHGSLRAVASLRLQPPYRDEPATGPCTSTLCWDGYPSQQIMPFCRRDVDPGRRGLKLGGYVPM
jgi:hypothetical protein